MKQAESLNLTQKIKSIEKQIQALHQKIKLGHDLQSELDRYIIVTLLIQQAHPVLTSTNIEHFILKPEHVFSVQYLPDIGKDIRELFYPRKTKNLILYLIEYSLPYIKHNRLSLPSMSNIDSTSVINFTSIMMGCLMGIFPHCKKRPTWPVRVTIYNFFHNMITSTSLQDIYHFCNNNVPLLRISIIEYFVFFIQNYMPVEFELNEVFAKDCSITMDTMYGNILFITDTFRQSCLQKSFDMESINASAILAVERMNRLCKGKTGRMRTHSKSCVTKMHNFFAACSHKEIQQIVNLPSIRHCAYTLRLQSEVSNLNLIHYAKKWQENIVVHSLPRNVVFRQYETVRKKLANAGFLGMQCMFLHVCFQCSSLKNSCHAIRFNQDSQNTPCIVCDQCKSDKYFVKINMIGRIVRVFDVHYYFCHFCCKVHQWRYDGCELSCCSVKPMITDRNRKRCILCDRLQCETLDVLDDRIGVIQKVHLCRWHMPYDHVIPYIHNLDALWTQIVAKTSKRVK